MFSSGMMLAVGIHFSSDNAASTLSVVSIGCAIGGDQDRKSKKGVSLFVNSPQSHRQRLHFVNLIILVAITLPYVDLPSDRK